MVVANIIDIYNSASNNILDHVLTNDPGSASHLYCAPGMSNNNAAFGVFNILHQDNQSVKE